VKVCVLSDGIYGGRNDRRIRFESWHDGLFSLVCHNIKHMVDIGICKARQNVGIMASMRFISLFLSCEVDL
jgi:hypothetical protein